MLVCLTSSLTALLLLDCTGFDLYITIALKMALIHSFWYLPCFMLKLIAPFNAAQYEPLLDIIDGIGGAVIRVEFPF